MNLAEPQSSLLTEAESLVRKFVAERGAFNMFALARYRDGKLGAVQPTEEFASPKEALVETLRVLLSLAGSAQIDAAVICTPMTESGKMSAIYDLEALGRQRVLAFQRYKKRLFGGWSFGEFEFAIDKTKLFAAQQSDA